MDMDPAAGDRLAWGLPMRHLITFAVLALLLSTSPAFAMLGEDMDSEHQTTQYGHIFGGILIGMGSLAVLVIGYVVFKGIRAEHIRGKKSSPFREEILDKLPKKQETLFLGEKVPDWKINNRQKATRAALKFLACTDNFFNKKRMSGTVDDAFYLVKTSIESRSLKKVAPLVTEECLEKLRAEIKRLRKKGEVHKFGRVEVTDVDIIHIEVPVGKTNHKFTALVSAKLKDYFADAESGELLRGDKKTYMYQEFWTFRRGKESWLVERIRPAGDMDRILEAKNVMAQVDLEEFTKDADPEFKREFVAK